MLKHAKKKNNAMYHGTTSSFCTKAGGQHLTPCLRVAATQCVRQPPAEWC